METCNNACNSVVGCVCVGMTGTNAAAVGDAVPSHDTTDDNAAD